MASSLSQITDNGLCTGCGGCAGKIQRPDLVMAMTEDGFLRPSPVSLTEAEEKVVSAICPGVELNGRSAEPGYHPLWGAINDLATGYAIDPEVRFRGSSGGVLTAIAIGLVQSGDVDFVVTNGPSPQDPINNETVVREQRDGLIGSAGSRYAPSSPLANLEQHLSTGKRFAFIGKPCDIAGLARLAEHDPRIKRQIPYRLSFFCAGVPSRNGTMAVLEKLGVEHADCARFQYRGDGWPGLARATRHDGSEASMDYNSSWGTILNRHLQFRCKICPDGIGEFADLVCADAWYGKDGYPDFTERDGRSLILARTEIGQRLFDRARTAEWIASEPLDVKELEQMQPYQANRKRNVIARTVALFMARRRFPSFRHLDLFSLAFASPKVAQLRNAWGTFRRARARYLP